MSALRDLVVSIDFDDIDIDKLIAVDSVMDEIEEQLIDIDDEIGDVSKEFTQMGIVGSSALNEIQDETTQAIVKMAVLEEGIEDVTKETRGATIQTALLGNMFTLTGLKGMAMGVMITAGIAGLVAILAPLVVLVAGLGASLLAAGAGIVAFGAVAMGVFAPLINDAENLTAAQQAMRTELESFAEFWKGFIKPFETPIFEIAGTGLELVKNILTGLEPTIYNVTGVIGELMDEMNNSVIGGGLKDFFEWLDTYAAESIYKFAYITGDMLAGLWKMFAAFSPIGAAFEEGLASMMESFNEWAGNLAASDGFQKFVDYALQNGPVLMDVLGNLFSIIGDVIVALAPLGSLVLTGLQLLTGFISTELTPKLSELGGFIQQVASAFVDYLVPIIEPLAQELLPVLSSWFDTLKNLGLALYETFLSILPTLQDIFETVFPIVVDVVMKLYEAISALINNVVIPLLPYIAIIIREVWGVVKPILEPLKSLFDQIAETVMFLINEVISPLIPIIADVLSSMWKIAKPILDGVFTVFGNIADAVTSVIDEITNLASKLSNFKLPGWVSSLGGAIKDGFNFVMGKPDGSHATGLERVPFDNYSALLHKNEAVLTAQQSDVLREAGILSSDGTGKPVVKVNPGEDYPQLEINPQGGGDPTTTPQVNINININGADKDSQQLAQEIKAAAMDAMNEVFRKLNLKQPTPGGA